MSLDSQYQSRGRIRRFSIKGFLVISLLDLVVGGAGRGREEAWSGNVIFIYYFYTIRSIYICISSIHSLPVDMLALGSIPRFPQALDYYWIRLPRSWHRSHRHC